MAISNIGKDGAQAPTDTVLRVSAIESAYWCANGQENRTWRRCLRRSFARLIRHRMSLSELSTTLEEWSSRGRAALLARRRLAHDQLRTLLQPSYVPVLWDITEPLHARRPKMNAPIQALRHGSSHDRPVPVCQQINQTMPFGHGSTKLRVQIINQIHDCGLLPLRRNTHNIIRQEFGGHALLTSGTGHARYTGRAKLRQSRESPKVLRIDTAGRPQYVKFGRRQTDFSRQVSNAAALAVLEAGRNFGYKDVAQSKTS